MFEKDYHKVNLNNELNNAVMHSNLEKVRELLNLEEPPFVDHEINGVPLILYAAQKADWTMVEELYNAGADLDAKILQFNWSLLHECVKNAPDRVTKAVYEYCDINSQTKDGKTALMVAIKEKKIGMAEFFVDSGRMDFSLVDKKHNNAAHYAAEAGEYDLFIKLIQAGVPINKENYEDKNPIDLIKDVSFKENLPKVLGELAKIEKKKQDSENVIEESVTKEVVKDEPAKPKVSGLSSIKKKK